MFFLRRHHKNWCYALSAIVTALFCSQAAASPQDGSDTYHAAKAYKIAEQQYDHVSVAFEEKTSLTIKGCDTCPADKYQYLAEASKIIGKGVYQLTQSDYIIEQESGLLIWAKIPAGLGNKPWSRLDPYNILAKDRSYVRQLYTNTQMQNDVKKTLLSHSRAIKKQLASSDSQRAVSMR